MHGLLGGDVGNGEGAVERVANAAAAEHSSTEKRREGRKEDTLGLECIAR